MTLSDAPLAQAAKTTFLAEHPDWELDGETISRTFVFDDFIESMGFVTRCAIVSEVVDHHPDIDIRWNKVTIALTTHSSGALSEKDTVVASRLDALTS